MDRVIIPTHYRPEYLALCLEHIANARGSRDLDIRIYHDQPRTNAVGDTLDIAKRYNIPVTVRSPHQAVGNTLNFLEAYAEAYHSEARYVYLIEDDVLVGADFFDWHEAVQARADYFCSVAWHCIRNPAVKASTDPHAYIESAVDFSSIGVCWNRAKLVHLYEHATANYYLTPAEYMAIHFKGSPIPFNRWVEQAGLIMRLLLAGAGSRVVAWSAVPRCAHIGVSGYHRSKGPQFTGSVTQKIDQLERAIRSGQFAAMARDMFDDINTPIPAQPWEAKNLYVAQHF